MLSNQPVPTKTSSPQLDVSQQKTDTTPQKAAPSSTPKSDVPQSKIFHLDTWLKIIKSDAKLINIDLSSQKIYDTKGEAKLTKTFLGHMTMSAVVALPDGRLASASSNWADNSIRLWDPTGKIVATLSGHSMGVYVLAVLPDGQLVSGSDNSEIKLWDLASNSCVRTLEGRAGPDKAVSALAVLPDGRLASGLLDGSIKLWNFATNGVISLTGHKEGISALAVLPDGHLVSGSFDGTIKLWDSKMASCVATLKVGEMYVTPVALVALPDGRLASIEANFSEQSQTFNNSIKLWDPKTGSCMATLNTDEEGHEGVIALAVLPDGRLASQSLNGSLKLWDPVTGSCGTTLNNDTPQWHKVKVDDESASLLSVKLAVLPDGRLVCGGIVTNGTIKLWDLGTRALQLKDIEPLLAALAKTTVQHLNLQHCELTDHDVPALLKRLSATNLTAVDLCKTSITQTGIATLYQGLKHHPTLKQLHHEMMPALLAAEKANQQAEKEKQELKKNLEAKEKAEAANKQAELEAKLRMEKENQELKKNLEAQAKLLTDIQNQLNQQKADKEARLKAKEAKLQASSNGSSCSFFKKYPTITTTAVVATVAAGVGLACKYAPDYVSECKLM